MDPVGPGLVLPILVPWWLPKLSRVVAGEGGDTTMHVGHGHSTWAERSSSLSCRRLFQLRPQLAGLCSCPRGPEFSSDAKARGGLPFLSALRAGPCPFTGTYQAGDCSFSAESHQRGLSWFSEWQMAVKERDQRVQASDLQPPCPPALLHF